MDNLRSSFFECRQFSFHVNKNDPSVIIPPEATKRNDVEKINSYFIPILKADQHKEIK